MHSEHAEVSKMKSQTTPQVRIFRANGIQMFYFDLLTRLCDIHLRNRESNTDIIITSFDFCPTLTFSGKCAYVVEGGDESEALD